LVWKCRFTLCGAICEPRRRGSGARSSRDVNRRGQDTRVAGRCPPMQRPGFPRFLPRLYSHLRKNSARKIDAPRGKSFARVKGKDECTEMRAFSVRLGSIQETGM